MTEALVSVVFVAATYFSGEVRAAVFTTREECRLVLRYAEQSLTRDGDDDDDAISDCMPVTLKFRKPGVPQ